MTTEEIIDAFMDAGKKAFKADEMLARECRKLDRHEPVILYGTEVRYWREALIIKTAEHIRKVLPESYIEVVLDGNNSQLHLELTDEEKRKLTTSIYSFLRKYKCID